MKDERVTRNGVMPEASETPTIPKAITDKVDNLVDNDVDSRDSEVRYLAYGARIRTALRTSLRYVAYVTSDVGEAFRPLLSSIAVRAAYGISWAYIAGDVGYESYKAHKRGPTAFEAANFSEPTRISITAVQRATFQSVASMALPALTIHTIVSRTKKVFDTSKSLPPRVKMWGPTLMGLSVVPALPYLFDHPVEMATEQLGDWAREWLAGVIGSND